MEKVFQIVACISLILVIVFAAVSFGEAGTTSTANELRKINKKLDRIEKQQKHDSIEYVEILDNGINVVYADGTGAFWGDQRTHK